MELLLALAGVVSALAALGAVWFAYQTVREARALRREDRLMRLPELVEDAGDALLQLATRYGRGEWEWPLKSLRLRAALAPLDDPLPACRQLASGSAEGFGDDSADPIRALTGDALREVAELLQASR